ncbi:GyrI-like domain-containing protein [Pseudomonas sp. IT-P4]|uniref:GyrI-like domain-containing protein n=1 Tax=Pseudomonas sp. IT-P4 TaxID=3026446 RepID=UPI0039E13FDF
MEPNIAHISRFLVSGLTVRTRNQDESRQESAKIPGLWGQFFASSVAEQIPDRLPNAPVVGVYSTYESDANGLYNVTAGVPVTETSADFDSIEIQEGKYLVFEARGPMPAAVIQAWGDIWNYFEQHQQVQRRYATDFESYGGPDEVRIHIGVVA